MHYDATPTALIEQSVNWAQYAPYQPSRPAPAVSGYGTRSSSKEDPFELFTAPRGAWAPTFIQNFQAANVPAPVPVQPKPSAAPGATDRVDRIAKQRVQLLAIKYANQTAITEVTARLEILNQQLLGEAPRVSQAQVQALEQASQRVAEIRQAREARSKLLGLSI